MSSHNIRKFLYAIRFVPIVLCALFIALVLWRIPAVSEKEKTQETVLRIKAQKITADDVWGARKPMLPDAAENNATLAGIDSNNNGIRDDVELVLLEQTLPPHVRAGELQYVRALQTYLIDVFNNDTWEAAAVQENRAYQCLGQALRDSGVHEDDLIPTMQRRVAELEALVFNTPARKKAYDEAMSYITGFGLEDFYVCDVEI